MKPAGFPIQAVSAVVICGLAGFGFGKLVNPGESSKTRAPAENANPSRPAASVRTSPLEDFQSLLAPESRETDIWKIVSRIPPDRVREAIRLTRTARQSEASGTLNAARLKEIESALYFRWAENDPQSALADVSAIPKTGDPRTDAGRGDLAESVLAAWMRMDANAAYRAVKDDKDFGYKGRNMLVNTWTPENLFESLAIFPDKHEDLLGWYCVAAAKDESRRNAMLAVLREQPDMKDRRWAYEMLFRDWAYRDFPAAMMEAEKHDQTWLKDHVLEGGLYQQPAAAMRWAISQNIAPGGRMWSQGYLNWLRTDTSGAKRWLAEQAPAWKSAGHFAALADLQAEQLGLTEKVDMETAKPLWTSLMSEWRSKDPEAAEKWLERDPSGAVRGILNEKGNEGGHE